MRTTWVGALGVAVVGWAAVIYAGHALAGGGERAPQRYDADDVGAVLEAFEALADGLASPAKVVEMVGRVRSFDRTGATPVLVVTDATAGAITEHYDGYAASLVNFRMVASAVDNTDNTVNAIKAAYRDK